MNILSVWLLVFTDFFALNTLSLMLSRNTSSLMLAVPKHFVPDAVPIKPNYDGSFCSFLWSPNSVASSNLDSLEWGRSPFVIADF